MLRTLALLTALVAVSCMASEAPARTESTQADSTMVVATDSVVPSDRPVVVFLGTSLTAGLGLEREADTFVSVLESMADSAGTPFRAVNAGVSGETSAGGLRRLDWVLRNDVDVLVVELGANDGLRGQSPAALQDNLTRIIRQARSRQPDIRVILAGMEAPPNLGASYTAAFRAVFPQVAASEETYLIPFLLDGVAGVPELNQSDRIHPEPEGHRRIAATAWPVLEEALRSLPESNR